MKVRLVCTSTEADCNQRKIYFETSKSVIKDASFSLLNEIADLILEHELRRRFGVEGHTDSDGGETYNLDLSQARAEAVVDYFVQRGGSRSVRSCWFWKTETYCGQRPRGWKT